jgi:hypothetical protein
VELGRKHASEKKIEIGGRISPENELNKMQVME